MALRPVVSFLLLIIFACVGCAQPALSPTAVPAASATPSRQNTALPSPTRPAATATPTVQAGPSPAAWQPPLPSGATAATEMQAQAAEYYRTHDLDRDINQQGYFSVAVKDVAYHCYASNKPQSELSRFYQDTLARDGWKLISCSETGSTGYYQCEWQKGQTGVVLMITDNPSGFVLFVATRAD